ncbi:MAG: hypothetical protein AB1689_19460 [Thermodesulfobacteriota bacterium]
MTAHALATEPDSTRQETGEQRLLAALLHTALHDARKGRRDALAWLMSDAAGACVGGFNFIDVAGWLGLDPAWCRAQAALRVRPRGRRTVRGYVRRAA